VRSAAACLTLVLLLAACGGDDEGSTAETTTAAATTAAATTDGGSTGATTGGADGCETVDAPEPKTDGGESAPTEELDGGSTYALVVDTTCGSFTITLDPKRAPKTAASLVALADAGFFDGTTFHRVVPGFVIQGGDPTGTGTGGPGYQTVDVPPAGTTYTRGVVAMAKAGFEAPGTSGSQFFVVTGDDIGLPPEYAVVGEVTAGMDTVLAIDALGIGDGPPEMPVVIERVEVETEDG
jgi:peptidyl-prolyl cis-trans isomerase B (cyclophilin B)